MPLFNPNTATASVPLPLATLDGRYPSAGNAIESTDGMSSVMIAGPPHAPSGTYGGLNLIRNVDPEVSGTGGVGIGFWSTEADDSLRLDWDMGQDHSSNDLVLAYDATLEADVIRLAQGGPWVTIGNSASPIAGSRLSVYSTAADTSDLVTLLRLQIDDEATPASATHLAIGTVEGANLFGVQKDGGIMSGRSTRSNAIYFTETLRNQNERTYHRISNPNTGNAAQAGLTLSNSADNLQLAMYSTGHAAASLAGTGFIYTSGSKDLLLGTTGTERARIKSTGSIALGKAALATNATTGFVYLPSMAGTPTGTPETFAYNAGVLPVVLDSSASKLWAYVGGAWKSVTLS